MILGILIGLFVGVHLGFFVAGLFASAKQGDEQLKNTPPDPYDFAARQERVDRALARENVTRLDRSTHFDDVFATREDHP